ncbi:hypothetical protein [Novosphingobium colocasiae]|uniref:hypothetical protein n=1 Tax=Novosphingobium colocasiae TaxID=1256513 RepID=UPI0035B0B011
MAASLLLDRATWDICLSANGDIAVASEPYSLEQDVASECRLFRGEAYFDTSLGIPYPSILGRPIPAQLYKEELAAAAQRVPGVTEVTVYLSELSPRAIGGQIQFSRGTATL